MLKTLQAKRAELYSLESKLAAEILQDLDAGGVVEPGELTIDVRERQRGTARVRKLSVWKA